MGKSEYRDMWVYLEVNGGKLNPVSLELCCEARRLCDESGERLIGVAAGAVPESELAQVKECGVDGLLLVSGAGYERYSTEAYTRLFTELCRKYRPVGGVRWRDGERARLCAAVCGAAGDRLYERRDGADLQPGEPGHRVCGAGGGRQDNGSDNHPRAAPAGGDDPSRDVQARPDGAA